MGSLKKRYEINIAGSQAILEGIAKSHQQETTAGSQSFPVAGQEKKEKPEAGEVRRASLVKGNPRNQRNYIDQKDQFNSLTQFPATSRER